MKRLIRETEKPSFPAQCRVLAEAAVLWTLLAAGAQLLLPAEKTALPEGAALAWAALRICLVTPLAEELAFRGGALYLLQPLGGAGAVVVQAVIFAALARQLDGPGLCAGHGAYLGWAARKAKSVWLAGGVAIINNCLVFAARLAERGMG
ncbi:MAG: lysostaphin resistance A-like protein [Faecalibacterium prausnitzii]